MKYEITDIEHPKLKGLFRIRALKDFFDVEIGVLGGYIQSYNTLSQDGDCWIYEYACVYENARVQENALIHNFAKVYGNARIYGNAQISGKAEVFGNACVSSMALVCENSKVYGNAHVFGSSFIFENAEIYGNANINLNNKYFGSKINKGQITEENLKHFIKLKKWFPQLSTKQK